MKKFINQFIVLFIGAVFIAPWTGCSDPPVKPTCTEAQKADPTNDECFEPPPQITFITATIATFSATTLDGVVNNNVICTGATPNVTLTITSPRVTAANFARAFPKKILANVVCTPKLNPSNPTITIQFPITTITLTQALPVSPNQTGTPDSLGRGETYEVTIQLVDGNNSLNTFNFGGSKYVIIPQ